MILLAWHMALWLPWLQKVTLVIRTIIEPTMQHSRNAVLMLVQRRFETKVCLLMSNLLFLLT